MSGPAAVVDIGTNTLLLLLAERVGAEVRVLADECRFGRLGQGLDQSGNLAPEAIARSLDIVREYRSLMDRHGVTEVRVVATQALREAGNAREFVAPAQVAFGATIEVIAGEREAELVHKAVARSLPELGGQRLLVVDVGGGSTEFVLAGPDGVESYRSIPIGSVRHTERHLRSDPPTPEQVAALVADLDAAIGALALPGDVIVVGTAGTATTIAAVELRLEPWDPARVQGLHVSAAAIDTQLEGYWQLSVAERKKLPGLEPQRADVIAAGAAIFARVLHHTRARELIVSDRGVRWGMMYELLDTRAGSSL